MARLFQPTARKESTPSALKDTPAGMLKAVTYNLLADKYAVSGFHSYCPTRWLEWGYRLPRILIELDSYDADVICLQEVSWMPCVTNWFAKPLLKAGDMISRALKCLRHVPCVRCVSNVSLKSSSSSL